MSQPDTDTRIDDILIALVNSYIFNTTYADYAGAHKAIKDLIAEQVAAEYKQLLNAMPEKIPPIEGIVNRIDLGAVKSTGFNDCLDQCRAIIEARIKGDG